MQDSTAFMTLEKAVGQTIQTFPDGIQASPRWSPRSVNSSRGLGVNLNLSKVEGTPKRKSPASPRENATLSEMRFANRTPQKAQSGKARPPPPRGAVSWASDEHYGYRTTQRPPFLALTEGLSPSLEPLTLSTVLDQKLLELLKVIVPTQAERERRLRVLRDLERTLAPIGLHVEAFGSTLTGLTTMESDLDCVMIRNEGFIPGGAEISPKVEDALKSAESDNTSMGVLRREVAAGVQAVAKVMRRARAFNKILAIAHAKVPIVKCLHLNTGINVDLSFVRDGLRSSYFLCTEYMRPGNEMARALTVLVKTAVASSGLGDPSKGGLGSFPIALMVLFFLQTEVMEKYPDALQRSLAVLFSGFMKFYGRNFDFQRQGIDYIQRKTFKKSFLEGLYIINPICPGVNCARAAERYAQAVIPFFSKTADKLCSLLDEHVSESHVEGVLSGLFRNVLSYYGGWFRVCETAKKYRDEPQHQWDSTANMYVGGLVDNLI
ncbi:unnamed protein product [Phytomonas sp. EM1]|nr:unnamed protein product [Phytomonas sp. EM1]|eukprot:CCW64102.1 unnamed protein product [Phytomonas sp. isolate EM1]